MAPPINDMSSNLNSYGQPQVSAGSLMCLQVASVQFPVHLHHALMSRRLYLRRLVLDALHPFSSSVQPLRSKRRCGSSRRPFGSSKRLSPRLKSSARS